VLVLPLRRVTPPPARHRTRLALKRRSVGGSTPDGAPGSAPGGVPGGAPGAPGTPGTPGAPP